LVLVTENPATRRGERSSVGSAVTNLPFCPKHQSAGRPLCWVVDLEGDVIASAVDLHRPERIRGQIVGYRQRWSIHKVTSAGIVCEARRYDEVCLQFEGEYTEINEFPLVDTIGWLPSWRLAQEVVGYRA
jgi:hypothetical protein